MRAIDLEMAFSLNKQSAIGTAIADASIDRMLPYRTFAPSTQDFPNVISDKDWFGKGHSFASFWDPITKQVTCPSREYSLSNLSALFSPAFVLGKVVTSQPNSAVAATVFDHVFTFQDPRTNPDVIFTSFIEAMGSVYKRKISGAVIEQFTLNGVRTDHVTVAWQGFARKMETSVAAMPTLSTNASFFKTIKGTFKFNQSGQALVNISTKVLSWSLMCTQSPSKWWMPGNSTGEEDLLTKVRIGKQGASGNMVILLEDTTQKTLFENNTECEASIVLLGDQIGATGYYHTVTITIPHFKIPSEAFGDEQDQVSYTLPFTEQSMLKGASSEYLTITVRGTENAADLLVSA